MRPKISLKRSSFRGKFPQSRVLHRTTRTNRSKTGRMTTNPKIGNPKPHRPNSFSTLISESAACLPILQPDQFFWTIFFEDDEANYDEEETAQSTDCLQTMIGFFCTVS